MFGLMTVAKHQRTLTLLEGLHEAGFKQWERERAELHAEIAALRPLAEKHLRSLANLKQNKSRTLA